MGHFHRWTKAETNLLIRKYRTVGDTKLANLFNEKFPKKVNIWTFRHIAKKRSYLGLKRTKAEEHRLRCENNKDGRHFRSWDTRGRMQEGEIRTWDGKQFIRHEGKVIPYHRYIMDAKPGEVVRRIGNEFKIITRQENALYNTKMRTQYPEELKEAIKTLNQLTKLINGKENTRP